MLDGDGARDTYVHLDLDPGHSRTFFRISSALAPKLRGLVSLVSPDAPSLEPPEAEPAAVLAVAVAAAVAVPFASALTLTLTLTLSFCG